MMLDSDYSIPKQVQPRLLKLALIKLDPAIQPRQQLNQQVAAEYAEAIRQGMMFPPVIVFHDGEEYWLADGFHRVNAKESIGEHKILAEVRSGSRRDAILFAVGANVTYGLHRTNTDKRLVVERLLLDSEWSQWSDNAIAQRCGVSNTFVGKLRRQSSFTFNGSKSNTRKGTDGRVIDTQNIGQKRKNLRVESYC